MAEVCPHSGYRDPGICPQCVSLYCLPAVARPEPIAETARETLEEKIASLDARLAALEGLFACELEKKENATY